MPQRLAAFVLVVVAGASLLADQSAQPVRGTPQAAASADVPVSPALRWSRAADAWDGGHYPEALGDLTALMRSPAGAEYLDRIALLTGEIFTTTTIATDGRNIRISARGQYASYESGPFTDPITRIVRLTSAGAQQVAEAHATNLTFGPSGTHAAWLRAPQTPEWIAVTKTLDPASKASGPERQAAQAQTSWLLAKFGEVVIRDLTSNSERVLETGGLLKSVLAWAADGRSILFIGADENDLTRSDIYLAGESATPERLTDQPGFKANITVDPTGAALMYGVTTVVPFRRPGAPLASPNSLSAAGGPGPGRGGGAPVAGPSIGIVDLKAKATRLVAGTGVTMSADGSTLAWIARNADATAIYTSPTLVDKVTTVRTTTQRMDAPALSPDGALVAYQFMSGVGSSTDWDIYVTDRAGQHRRVTRDTQHDLLPRFLTNDTLLAVMGEARHRRSHLYDLTTGTRVRLFANNSVRTISPEYIWVPSPDGKHLAIQADRDGDTVSPERGVHVVDLTHKIAAADLVQRLARQLSDENDLRRRMTTAFRPLADLTAKVVARASPSRVYAYEKAQFDFDSKHITQPGNLKAIEYLERTYASFGYRPEVQWFAPGGRQGGAPPGAGAAATQSNRTANVVATLRGTENPDLIYVVSSHFDSVAGGPGADDNTSGTSALLEAARILADTPLAATVVFASFTGEEGGLLGSREFVRLAAERRWNVAGALNNDMIGWAGESGRMDNTVRYSNAGIRDLQHGAAFLFTNLITYDSRYYMGTDAAAFYDAWGDIVGGLGGYPILANPNYHQPSDLIETINFQQVTETAKVTAATIIYLASSPSRLKGLKASTTASGVDVSWTTSPEAGVKTYVVAYGPAADPLRTRLTVTAAKATLPRVPAGTQVAVKAVNSRGLEGWDWARVTVE